MEVQIPTHEWAILRAKGGRLCTWPAVDIVKVTQPGEGGRTSNGADANWGVLDGGAHWCHLANTIELFVCGSYATLRQVTFTTCC